MNIHLKTKHRIIKQVLLVGGISVRKNGRGKRR
jgi:hypothetical protein